MQLLEAIPPRPSLGCELFHNDDLFPAVLPGRGPCRGAVHRSPSRLHEEAPGSAAHPSAGAILRQPEITDLARAHNCACRRRHGEVGQALSLWRRVARPESTVAMRRRRDAIRELMTAASRPSISQRPFPSYRSFALEGLGGEWCLSRAGPARRNMGTAAGGRPCRAVHHPPAHAHLLRHQPARNPAMSSAGWAIGARAAARSLNRCYLAAAPPHALVRTRY
jgi:hypothetical protein